MKTGLRRVAVVAVAALVVAPALATAASATSTFDFHRLAGIDRYATSVAVATEYGASTDVILASGVPGHYPDALTASYLAGEKNAPILLTKLAATPANVLARITASGATNVWIVGGPGVVSAAQETALDAQFGTVTRLGGLDRYLTAQAVIGEAGVATSTTAILATGVNFPDAIAGGPLSYVKGMPLAITLANRLPAATLSALKAAGTTNVIVLGGPTVVSQAVLDTLAANGITLNQRIFGANRSETSSKLATYMLTQGFSDTAVNVASGYARGGGADALGGGALSGQENRPTLITESVTTVGPGVIAFLRANAETLATGHIFGGLGAVSQAADDEMEAAARAVTTNQDLTVVPSAAVTLTVATEPDTTDDRTYTAAGLTDATAYTVALFPAANVTTDANGVVTFADVLPTTAGDGQADGFGDATVAKITKINSATLGTAVGFSAISSVNGSLNFTIDGLAPGSVVPVLFVDGGTAGALDLNAANQPTELFGLGGVTTYLATAATSGAIAASLVDSVDKAGNTFSATETGGAGTSNSFAYDANDTFSVGGTSVGIVAFEAALSTGDGIAGSYTTDPAGVSNFQLSDVAPPAPTTVTADKGGTAATTNDITVTVVTGTTVWDSIVIQRAPVAGGTQGGTEVAGTFATIASPTTDADTTAGGFQYVDNNVTAGAYRYRAALVKDGDQGDFTTDVANETSTTPVNDGIAPTSADTRMAVNAGSAFTVDTGDTFTVAFSEVMLAPNAGDTLRLTDADGTVVDIVAATTNFALNTGDVIIGGVTYPANRVLTVTKGTADTLVVDGTLAGLGIPATVTLQAGTTDLAGNAWNLAGSADRVVDTE